MPTQEIEIRLVATVNREFTIEEQRKLGRDAAMLLLRGRGTRSDDYFDYSLRQVQSVRFNQFTWESTASVGPEYRPEWCVTDEERDNYDPEDDDEF